MRSRRCSWPISRSNVRCTLIWKRNLFFRSKNLSQCSLVKYNTIQLMKQTCKSFKAAGTIECVLHTKRIPIKHFLPTIAVFLKVFKHKGTLQPPPLPPHPSNKQNLICIAVFAHCTIIQFVFESKIHFENNYKQFVKFCSFISVK